MLEEVEVEDVGEVRFVYLAYLRSLLKSIIIPAGAKANRRTIVTIQEITSPEISSPGVFFLL